MNRYLHSICTLLFAGFFFGQVAKAQTGSAPANASIKGSVVEEKTQEPLPFVTVAIEGKNIGTSTDKRGDFSIEKLPAGIYNLVFSYLGYAQQKKENLRLEAGQVLDLGSIEMQESETTLKEVTVSPGSYSVMGNLPLSRQSFTAKDIKNMSFAEDVTRAVSRLPGVSSNDFSSKFTVRGGENTEVLMSLDGMELYEPFHQRDYGGGLVSIVDIETVQSIDLLTGGFSAEYGNRQSGVFNMRTKQVEDGQRHTSVGLSIASARVYTDGKFAKNRASYLFSARRGMLDVAFKLAGNDEDTPTFYDAMGKVEYKLSDKHTLSLHALQAGDKTSVRDINEVAYDIYDTRYGNTYGWLNLKSSLKPNLFAKTMLFGGHISHRRAGAANKNEIADKKVFDIKDKRDYSFFGLKQDWNWEVSERFFLKSGFEARQLNANYDYFFSITDWRINAQDSVVRIDNTIDIDKKPSGQQANAYVTGKFVALPKLFVETGLRYDFTSYTQDKLWSPRVSVAYAFSKKTFLRAAWGQYYQTQFINNLDVYHGNARFDPAELSTHYVLGFEHQFKQGISLRLEGYYKGISHLSPTFQNLRDPWEVFLETRNDVTKLDYRGASSKGIEVFLKYDMGKKISWWFSYALAEALEDIKSIEFEGALTKRLGNQPRYNNQRHTIYADLNYRPNQKWHLSLAWQYYVGFPRTSTSFASTVLPNGEMHYYQVNNEFRAGELPAYHRMDLRANRHFQLRKGRISAFVHVINVYNRQNLRKYGRDVVMDETTRQYVVVNDYKYWFGITPIAGASWEF